MANLKETSVFLEKKMQKKKKKVPHSNKKGPHQEHITGMSAFAASLESHSVRGLETFSSKLKPEQQPLTDGARLHAG